MKQDIYKILILFTIFFSPFNLFASDQYNPQAAKTNAQLGMAYLNKNMYAESKNRLLIALQEDPEIAAGWYSMGYYYQKTNNAKLAEQYYQKAISVEPTSGAAHNNYGAFLCQEKQYKNAISEFLSAINQPNYIHAASAYENAAMCALRIPDRSLAVSYFQKAIDNNPNKPYSLLSLAQISYQNGDTVSAERYFDDFVKISNLTSKEINTYRAHVFQK